MLNFHRNTLHRVGRKRHAKTRGAASPNKITEGVARRTVRGGRDDDAYSTDRALLVLLEHSGVLEEIAFAIAVPTDRGSTLGQVHGEKVDCRPTGTGEAGALAVRVCGGD